MSSIFLVYQCATRSAPSGGPVDRIPPQIISTEPESDTTGVATLDEIRIEFSERMNEGTLGRALFISPPLEYETEWKGGRILILQISDTLNRDQTYVVSIGSEASDSRGNKMDQSYQFAFSSGERIDQGGIGGTVYGAKRNETATLFAFTVRADTVDFSKKPDYISQSGSEGEFGFSYLKWGDYRIFAVIDQNNNLQIDTDYERVGIPFTDVHIDSSRSHFRGLNLRLTRSDTLDPEILGIRPVHSRHLQLRLSESVIPPMTAGFGLKDSLTSDSIAVLSVSRNRENANTLDIFTQSLDTAVYELTVPVLSDSAGNSTAEPRTLSFRGILKEDTTHFDIVSAEPADSSENHHPEAPLYLEFSNPVLWDSIAAWYSLTTAGGREVEGQWQARTAFNAGFIPNTPFLPDSSYVLGLPVEKVHDVWKNVLEDSSFSRYFTIMSEREMGEISGSVTAEDFPSRPVSIRVHHLQKRDLDLEQRLEEPGSFLKRYLPEGMYRVDAFLDLDNNAEYSAGTLFPFRFSEPFVFYPDTVKVRKRWETSGVNLVFPAIENRQ